jgi:hexosaminidase
MLLDTARHFLPVDIILDVIDAMAYNKLNILHAHLVDDQSWPLYSETLPLLTKAAYAPRAIYSHADISRIVQYAWERGIRVILEIDMPAHATAFGIAYPELTLSCPGGETLLNPVPSSTGGQDIYKVINDLFSEFIPIFGSDVIHIGGDEVQTYQCWNTSTEVLNFMAQQNFTTMLQLRTYFENKIQQLAKAHNVSAMVWEEVFDMGCALLPDTIVDAWLSFDAAKAAVAAGQPTVVSYGLYLNQQRPGGGLVYAFQDTWELFYASDVTRNQTFTPEEEALILGSSISQWMIQTDEQNVLQNMWPRASAAAERLWSPRSLTNITLAAPRIEIFRCIMAQRGIPAGPTTYSFCELPSAPLVGPIARALKKNKKVIF